MAMRVRVRSISSSGEIEATVKPFSSGRHGHALGRQPRQRLAHCAGAELELGRRVVDLDLRPWRKPARENRLAQGRIGRIRLRFGARCLSLTGHVSTLLKNFRYSKKNIFCLTLPRFRSKV